MLTIFREASTADGKPGPVSFRRVSSAWLFLLAPALYVVGFLLASRLPAGLPGWAAVAAILGPGSLCLIVGALMPILTTAESIKSIVESAAKLKGGAA
jgi:hypothetical protein